MDKKIRYIVGAIGVLIMLFAGYKIYGSLTAPTSTAKMIDVTIIDDNESSTLQLVTDKDNLADFLIEQNEKGTIKLTYDNSTYGMFITGLGLNEIRVAEAGEAWTYSSTNNAMCLNDASGYCPAAETLTIDNGDQFTFELIKF